MQQNYNYTTKKILDNIDAFLDGKSIVMDDTIQPYANLVNPWPFTSGKLHAKIANKVTVVPVKVIKKVFSAYFYQQDKELLLTQQRLSEIELKVDRLQDSLDQLTAHIDEANRKKS